MAGNSCGKGRFEVEKRRCCPIIICLRATQVGQRRRSWHGDRFATKKTDLIVDRQHARQTNARADITTTEVIRLKRTSPMNIECRSAGNVRARGT